MKFKKLLNVIIMSQPVRIVSTNGIVTKRTPIVCYSNNNDRPLLESLEEYKVHSIRHVHDDLQIPDYQDFIEITLIGGSDK